MQSRGIRRRLSINVTPSLVERLKAGVKQPNANGCIEWNYAMRNGYGAIKHEGRVLQAHAVAWAVSGGSFADDCVIAHKCDNKACCNPEHLECVSITKNNRDGFLRRKRSVLSGAMLPHTRLSESQALQIIELWQPRVFGSRRIAKELDLPVSLVESVVSGKSWINLPRKAGMQQVKRGPFSIDN